MRLLRAQIRAACCRLPYCAVRQESVRLHTTNAFVRAIKVSVVVCSIGSLSVLSACVAKRQQYDVPAVALPNQFLKADTSKQFLKVDDAARAALPIFPATANPSHADLAKIAAQAPAQAPAQANVQATTVEHPQPSPTADNASQSPQLDQWWLSLGSKELNELVQRALENNPDLKIATLRVEQARLRSAQASSKRLPEVSVPIESKIESPAGGLGSVPIGGSAKTQRTYQGSLRADWQLDIWGEKQAEFESSQMQWWRAVFARDDAQRSLLASLASSYIEYLTLNDRIRIAQDTSVALSAMLATVQQRFDRQDATITELEQQRAAVFAVRATLPGLLQQRMDVLNSMHFLLGVQSHQLQLSQLGLASLQLPKIEPGVPSSLLLRRPDVRVMEARLLSADADIDVARARILPQLNLTAQYGVGSHVLSELFSPQSRLWSVVAALSANIFDGGRQRAEIDYARSVHQEMVETYMRVVYVAIREVNAALSSIQSNEQRQSLQQEAVQASLRAWQHGKTAWHAGALENTALLESERSYHRNLDELLRIKQERFRGVVNLYVALGGGIVPAPALPGKGQRPQLTALPSAKELIKKAAEDSATVTAHSEVAQASTELAKAATTDASIAVSESPAITQTSADNAPSQPTPSEAEMSEALPGLTIFHSKIAPVQSLWVAEIAQIGGREHIAQHWRGLREQYPDWMAGRFVVARAVRAAVPPVGKDSKEQGKVTASKKSLAIAQHDTKPTGKYLLYVGNFLSIEQGEAWCEELRTVYPTCQVLPSEAIGGRSTRLRMSVNLTQPGDDLRRSASSADELGESDEANLSLEDSKPTPAEEIVPADQGTTPGTTPDTTPSPTKPKGGEHAAP